MILGKVIKFSKNRKIKRQHLALGEIHAQYELDLKQQPRRLITQLYRKYYTIKQWSKIHKDLKKELLNKYHVTITMPLTMKEWNRFNINDQQILTTRYQIILTDHQTRNEKIVIALKKITLKNFDTAMSKFDKHQKSFWKSFDEGFNKAGVTKRKVKVF